MIPKKSCTRAARGSFDFEDASIRPMKHVESSALDASNADGRVRVDGRLTDAPLLHDQMPVLDFDIVPVVFGIQPDGWIVGSLLVVVDDPILVEGCRERVV